MAYHPFVMRRPAKHWPESHLISKIAAMPNPGILIDLPAWLGRFVHRQGRLFDTVEQRMELAVDLSRENVRHQTGGPFGAVVFEEPEGRLLAVGVNLVTSLRCSVAHAEMVATVLAQQARGHYDLGATGSRPCQLVTSCEPCAMCLGAIPWSGIKAVVCGARGEDAESIGFDEGVKPKDWVAALQTRGIAVIQDVLRPQARAVLLEYRQTGGVIY